MPRKLNNFIDGFMRYTDGKGSPSIYRKWTGIFLVSAAMERKCWMLTVKGKQYPNQYLVLTGPAGVGKSLCTSMAFDLLDTLRTPETPFYLAPTSVTRASIIDKLDAAQRRIIRATETPSVVTFNSLTVVANEFGVFLPSWEGDFMAVLTDLWDCKRYAESRRTANLSIEIPNAQLNILSADTPSHLNTLLPEGAWESGFMSRTLVIFSSENIHTHLFQFAENDEEMWKSLVHDLRDVYRMYGEFTVSEEAKEAINEWAKAGGPPIPDHPKLMSYRTRRPAHLLKLCMVASAASDSDRIITLDHFAEALDWLVEAETYMPDVFKSMKTGGDARAVEECWHYAFLHFSRHKTPVPEHLIVAFLQERVPAHSIKAILEVMERAQLLTKKMIAGGYGYEPKARSA